MMIRKATLEDARAIGEVHLATWNTTYRGLVPGEFLDTFNVDEREETWKNRLGPNLQQIVYVAEDEGKIVGFASGGKNRGQDEHYTAEIYALYVLQSHQRHGLGRRLIAAVARELQQQGHQHMLIWVLSDNPIGRPFYERIGGVWIREKLINFGVNLMESAYGYNIEEYLAKFGGE
ncbi:MAG: GNAT family N-acetyltransferase [Anaerolineae bacterium]